MHWKGLEKEMEIIRDNHSLRILSSRTTLEAPPGTLHVAPDALDSISRSMLWNIEKGIETLEQPFQKVPSNPIVSKMLTTL